MTAIITTKSELDYFSESLQDKTFYTNSFDNGIKLASKSHALKHKYTSVNRLFLHYLIFDIDRTGSVFDYEDRNLPPPNIIVNDKKSLKCHYLYRLATPVSNFTDSRVKPLKFYASVEDSLARALDSDMNYTGFIVKNPFYSKEHTAICPINSPYELQDFTEWVSLSKGDLPSQMANTKPMGLSRNCDLFDTVRKQAYKMIHSYTCYELFYNKLLALLDSYNNLYPVPVQFNELKHIAKSIATFCFKYRDTIGNSSTIGKLELPDTISANDRKKLGAIYSHAVRKDKTMTAIEWAIKGIVSKGKKPTHRLIALESRVSLETVKKYRDFIKQIT